jgi:hypothetical protein
MRKVSMAMRRELVKAVGERYRAADRAGKSRILDEFVAVTGLLISRHKSAGVADQTRWSRLQIS